MGTSSAKKKNKGPKGKKARAKAKLLNQWGQTGEPSEATYARGSAVNKTKKNHRRNQEVLDEFNKTTTRRSHNNNYYEDDDSVASNSASSSSSEDEYVDDDENGLNSLMQRVHKTKRHNTSQQMIVEEEDEDDDDDDSSSSSEGIEKDNSSNGENEKEEEIHLKGDLLDQFETDPYISHYCVSDYDNYKTDCEKHMKSALMRQKQFEFHVKTVHDGVANLYGTGEVDEKVLPVLTKHLQEKHNAIASTFLPNTQYLPTSALYPSLINYMDLLLCTNSHHIETSRSKRKIVDQGIEQIIKLHIKNHVTKSLERVKLNDYRLESSSSSMENHGEDGVEDEEDVNNIQDQGYTRPKVLVLLPTRGTALQWIHQLVHLWNPEYNNNKCNKNMTIDTDMEKMEPNKDGTLDLRDWKLKVLNWDKFSVEYGIDSVDDDEDKATKSRRASVLNAKGDDWKELFGDSVNDDDDFKIGLSFAPTTSSKKKKKSAATSIKLYSEFYRSDIIIASPLSLKIHIEKENDFDFLSSIEIVHLSHSDVLLMQNWDHVLTIFDYINQQPKNLNDTDFSRVRPYFLSEQAGSWRQLIIHSKISDPYITSLFSRFSSSIRGQLKLRAQIGNTNASICDVVQQKVKQVFQRIDSCSKFSEQGDSRVKYFTEKLLPQLTRLKQKYTLIYIPSYFDFVAVRNVLLEKEHNSFVSVTEYSRITEVSRGRSRFLQGRKNIMLYTGRAHFFKRHNIKGVRHLIFLGLPEHAEFYSGMVNTLNQFGQTPIKDNGDGLLFNSGGDTLSCLSLYTKYEGHALERIVGTSNAQHMISKADKSTFLFSS